jgi:hypothetical protein
VLEVLGGVIEQRLRLKAEPRRPWDSGPNRAARSPGRYRPNWSRAAWATRCRASALFRRARTYATMFRSPARDWASRSGGRAMTASRRMRRRSVASRATSCLPTMTRASATMAWLQVGSRARDEGGSAKPTRTSARGAGWRRGPATGARAGCRASRAAAPRSGTRRVRGGRREKRRRARRQGAETGPRRGRAGPATPARACRRVCTPVPYRGRATEPSLHHQIAGEAALIRGPGADMVLLDVGRAGPPPCDRAAQDRARRPVRERLTERRMVGPAAL